MKRHWVPRLPRTVAERLPAASERLTVTGADALVVTGLPGPQPSAVAANLPYNVCVPVLLHGEHELCHYHLDEAAVRAYCSGFPLESRA